MAILANTMKGSLFFLVPIFQRPSICCLIFYKLIKCAQIEMCQCKYRGENPTEFKHVLKVVQEIRKYNRYSITFYPSSSALSNSTFFQIDPIIQMYILSQGSQTRSPREGPMRPANIKKIPDL